MPSEPQRPIEKLLKASAEARRAEFGVEKPMPNPMRARLHDEIARMNRAPETTMRRSWFARFWPQLSLGVAVAAALVIAAAVWLKPTASENNLPLAMNASAQPPQDAASVLKSLPAEPRLAQAEAARTEGLTSAPAPSVDQAASIAAAPPAAFAQAPAAQAARGQLLRNQATGRSAAGVLDSFQVEQKGQQIRLLDADGSTYSGELEAKVSAGMRAKRAAPASAAAPVTTAAPQAGVFFRASGFNQRLQKRVVVEGNYIALSPNEQKPAQTEQAPAPVRIIGTAQVAGEPPAALDAVAESR